MSGGKKKLEMVPDFSHVKKKKKTFGNYIDVYDTKVSHFLVVIVTRADKCESPYMKPFVTAFEEDGSGELSKNGKFSRLLHAREKIVETGPTLQCLHRPDQTLHGMRLLHTKVDLL